MCLLLLGRSVPCKTGCVKNVCLSQVQYSQSSQIPLLWLAYQNKPAIVFRDRDIVLLVFVFIAFINVIIAEASSNIGVLFWKFERS